MDNLLFLFIVVAAPVIIITASNLQFKKSNDKIKARYPKLFNTNNWNFRPPNYLVYKPTGGRFIYHGVNYIDGTLAFSFPAGFNEFNFRERIVLMKFLEALYKKHNENYNEQCFKEDNSEQNH